MIPCCVLVAFPDHAADWIAHTLILAVCDAVRRWQLQHGPYVSSSGKGIWS